jgi:hypothetical protein
MYFLGSYCLGSIAQPIFHCFCRRPAPGEYGLAPEHRLLAAIHDGADFLSRLRGQAELGAVAELWLAEWANFTRTFVSGVHET